MKRVFIESSSFSKRAGQEDPSVLREVQLEILKHPAGGDLIQGTGGLRKIRLKDPSRGKGKRGGFRVVYLDLSDIEKTYLLAMYDKNEKGDISGDEKKMLKKLVQIIKREAM